MSLFLCLLSLTIENAYSQIEVFPAVWGVRGDNGQCFRERTIEFHQMEDVLRLEGCEVSVRDDWAKAKCGDVAYRFARTKEGCEKAQKDIEQHLLKIKEGTKP